MQLKRDKMSIKMAYNGDVKESMTTESVMSMDNLKSESYANLKDYLKINMIEKFDSDYFPVMITNFVLPKFNDVSLNEMAKVKNYNINQKISEFFIEKNFEIFQNRLIETFGEEMVNEHV